MKYTILLFLFFLCTDCKEKKTDAEIESKLGQTMNNYLNSQNKQNTTFKVKDVLFTEKKDDYYCEFKVNMKSTDKDTTGTMTAFISKDFKKVQRGQ